MGVLQCIVGEVLPLLWRHDVDKDVDKDAKVSGSRCDRHSWGGAVSVCVSVS